MDRMEYCVGEDYTVVNEVIKIENLYRIGILESF